MLDRLHARLPHSDFPCLQTFSTYHLYSCFVKRQREKYELFIVGYSDRGFVGVCKESIVVLLAPQLHKLGSQCAIHLCEDTAMPLSLFGHPIITC